MKSPTLKRLTWAAVVVMALVALIAAGVSYLAASRLTGERIAEDMGEWSGFDVSIAASPTISVWPVLKAGLPDVLFSSTETGVSVRASLVEVELSVLGALSGDVNFTKARFINPVVSLPAREGTSAVATRGRIVQALEAANQAVAANRLSPDKSALPADNFGILEFQNASVFEQAGDTKSELASGLNGKLNWEKLNGRASASVAGIFMADDFSLDVSSEGPLLLLGGSETPMTLTLKSKPVNLAFSGTASLGRDPYAAGKLSLSTPSATMLSNWTGGSSAGASRIGAIALEGAVRIEPVRLRMEEAVVTLGNRSARGILDLFVKGQKPRLTGSLAFDTLDMNAILEAFSPFSDDQKGVEQELANRLDMDMRLSARRGSLGTTEITDIAASVRIDEKVATFDISDATALDGDVQASLRLDRRADKSQIEIRLLASDVNGAAFGEATGLGFLTPAARGNISLIFKGQGNDWRSVLRRPTGTLLVNIGPGALPNLDVETFVKRVKAGGAFPLQEVTSRKSSIDAIDVKAALDDGAMRFEWLDIRSPVQRIILKGSIQLDGSSTELTGTMELPPSMTGSTTEQGAPSTFRIDGPFQSATVLPAAVTAAQ